MGLDSCCNTFVLTKHIKQGKQTSKTNIMKILNQVLPTLDSFFCFIVHPLRSNVNVNVNVYLNPSVA